MLKGKQMTAERMARVEEKVSNIEVDIGEIKHALTSIAETLRQLTKLEITHQETKDAIGRAFGEIKSISDRVTKLEATDIKQTLITDGVVTGSKIIFERVIWLLFTALSSAAMWWIGNTSLGGN